jgi:cysteine desulfurase family protein (TIGR01976 family)
MPFDDARSRACRADFPALDRRVRRADGRPDLPLTYLDGPAGTQMPRPVIAAMTRVYETSNANTHGAFVTSRETDALIERARAAAAALLGAASPREISFGANMTTLAFALARGLARAMKPGDEVVITQLDHEANRGPWLTLAERGVTVREVALRPDGRLDPDDFARQVTPRTRLVAVGAASNALGTVNDLVRARELTAAVGAWLLVDAVHYAPHFPLDVAALDPDFLLCSAYKFYGPHVGILYTRPGLLDRLEPDRLCTQDQEGPTRIETGTLHHAALAGVTAAIEYLADQGEGADLRSRLISALTGISRHERAMAQGYWEAVRQIPGVTVWGPDFADERRAPTVSITVDGISADDVAARLAEDGVAVWSGHFYAVRAIETLGLAERGGVVRAGAALYTSRDDFDRLLAGIEKIAHRRDAPVRPPQPDPEPPPAGRLLSPPPR